MRLREFGGLVVLGASSIATWLIVRERRRRATPAPEHDALAAEPGPPALLSGSVSRNRAASSSASPRIERRPLTSRQLQGTAFVIFALVAATVVAGNTWRSLASPVTEPGAALAVEQRVAPAARGTAEIEFDVLPGMRAEEVAAAIAAAGAGDPDVFLGIVREPRRLGFDGGLADAVPSLEGYLHPGSYQVSGPGGEADLVREMVERASAAFSGELQARAAALGLTRHEVVTLASIIEREAVLDSERPVIAGVFHRRLAEGTRLASDPTVQYMVDTEEGPTSNGYWRRAIRSSDLRRPDPHNTYSTDGIPVGPIATPRLESIRAVLYPADLGYRFFISRGDNSTAFSSTFDEHLAQIAVIRAAGLGEAVEPESRLQQLVERVVAPLEAHVGVVVKDLITGESASVNGDDFFTSASLYKLGVLWAAFDARKSGDLSFGESVPISGARRQAGETLVVGDAIEDMIVTSDNTAALALLARLGRPEIESVLRRAGIPNTALTSRPLLTTPADVAQLLEDIAEQRAVDPAASAEMVDILRAQQIDDRLPHYLPEDVDIAHKTGDLAGLRHDAGILFLERGPVVVVAMVEDAADTEAANQIIGRLGRTVYEYFEEYLPAQAAFATAGRALCSIGRPSVARAGPLSGTLIALDPGHGSEDPGATFEFADGYVLQEKDVNLAAGTLLAGRLVEHGASVQLTRCDDSFLTPVERAALVNSAAPDLAISLHVNQANDPAVNGTSVFHYSSESEALANYLIGSASKPGLWSELSRSQPLPNQGVLRNWLEFLVHTDVPAALTESLYLSAPAEAELLRASLEGTGSRIEEIADGHVQAVLAYVALADQAITGDVDAVPVGATPLRQLIYERAEEADGQVALTFDDCNKPTAWESILETLSRERLVATFFCTTRSLLENPDLAKRTVAAGHAFGSHTYDHTDLAGLPPIALRGHFVTDQLAWDELGERHGVTRAAFLRPPFGAYDERVLLEAQRAGFERVIMWDVDSEDWRTDDPTAVVERVIDETTEGSIVLLHVLDTTAEALPEIAAGLRAKGLSGVGLGQLLDGTGASSPPSPSTARTAQGGPPAPAPGHDTSPDERQATSGTVTVTAVGDIVMGTTSNGLPKRGGDAFFDDVRDVLSGDVVLGNLEGTLSTGGLSRCEDDREAAAESEDSNDYCLAFQMPPEGAQWLRETGFTVMNLANNHTYDYGNHGVSQTLEALGAAGLAYTGMPGHVTLQQVGEIVVAVVGFSPNSYAPDLRDVPAAERLVRSAAARADVVVVTMHAGGEGPASAHVRPGTEIYLGEDRGDPMRFAHAVVDAGADLVVGHGPHVLRGLEWYKGRLIAYSLRNFGAYNVFNLDGPRKLGGVLRVKLNADGTWAGGKLVPTYLRGKGIPVLDPDRRALGLVGALSADDFARRAVRVARGRLLPPRDADETAARP